MSSPTRLFVTVFLIACLFVPSAVFAAQISYDYDDLGRLTQMTHSDGYTITEINYTYDNVGNFIDKAIATSDDDPDGDQLPTGWELEHGLDPNDSNDAALDTDNDGLTNLEEYQGGSDPLDPHSGPAPVPVPAVNLIGMILAALAMALVGFWGTGQRIRFFTVLLLAGLVSFSAVNVQAAVGPGWHMVEGTQITPEQARAFYASDSTISPQNIGLASATEVTQEITALARALQNDPRLIYEYVRNHIDYVPYYGSLKGATLTYLDGSGNDFDQASLMIALLRVSGYTAQYKYGTMTIPAYGYGDQSGMDQWLGVNSNTYIIARTLANGAIPYTSLGGSFRVDRVWVEATIDSSTYLFDPAFKPYRTIDGIDLKAAMNYDQSTLLNAAGGTLGTDSIQNIDENSLRALLSGTTLDLVNYIRTNYPNATMQEIIGGREIIPQTLTELPISLDFPAIEDYTWVEIPDAYIHKVRIQHGEIDTTLSIPDLAGKKLSLTYEGTVATQSVSLASQSAVADTQIPTTSVEPEFIPRTITPPYVEEGSDENVIEPMADQIIPFGMRRPADSPYPADPPVNYPSMLTFSNTVDISGSRLHLTVSLVNNTSGAFALTGGGGSHSVPYGSNVAISASFSAAGQSYGSKTARLKVVYYYSAPGYQNSATNTIYYTLSGTVVRWPHVSGVYYDFGQDYPGQVRDGNVSLTNDGPLALAITSVQLIGTNPSQFQILSGGSSGSLSSGQKRTVGTRYLASSVGSHSATIRINFNYDGINDHYHVDLPLSGQTLAVPSARLWLDETLIAQESASPSGSDLGKLFLSVTHPYDPAVLDVDSNRVDYNLKRGSTYAIAYDFGGSADGRLLEKRQRQMQTYRETGYSDSSREVLTETLNVLGMTWMRDTTLSNKLLCDIGKIIDINHHRFGIVAQESGYYIDVKTQVSSTTAYAPDSISKPAYFKASTFMASAMEHGVLEQNQVDRPAASTIKLLQLNNANGGKVFQVDSSNFTTISPQLVNYSSADINTFQSAVSSGETLILPENGQIELLSWAGKGYVSYSGTHVGMIIGGDYYGGYGAIQAPISIPSVNNQTSPYLEPDASIEKYGSGDPVDMVSGYWMSDATDLTLAGAAGGLSFKRSYISGNNNSKGPLGYGWSHNYDLYVEKHSNSPYGLGIRAPLEAATMIVTSVATMDLMGGTPDIKDWTVGSLIGKWGMDGLIDNAAGVHLDTDILTFTKLPDGTFISPPGVTSTLVLENGLYRVDERFDRTVTFNSNKKASVISDADGNTVSFTYSGDLLDTVSDTFGHHLNFGYNNGLLTSVSDSAGRSISYHYTGDELTRYTDPEGKQWYFAYDGNHRILSLTNPLGITTVTNVYDAFGRVESQTIPRQSGTATYNLYFSGYRNVEEDAEGNLTVYHFDRHKNLISVENALGQRNLRTFDGQKHVTAETDARGNTITFTYDGNHNLVQIDNPLHQTTRNSYDAGFHLVEVQDPLQNTVEYAYDAEHHPYKISVSPYSGKTISTETSYFANGQVHTSKDGKNVVTTLTYDNYGNPKTSKTSTYPALTYVYDNVGRMLSLTDQEGATTTFVYDDRGLLIRKTDPLSKSISLTYYDDGKLHTLTDRNNETTTYTYTASGKAESVSYQDGTSVSYVYDVRDNLRQMTDSLGATSYNYDAAGRLISSTDPRGFSIGTSYDDNGNIASITYPGNKTVSYTYDALNRLKTVTIDWLNKTATYNYDDAGRLDDLTQFNGTYTDYTYDGANRLIGLSNRLANAGSVIAAYSYSLDDNGNRTDITQTEPLNIDITAASIPFTMNLQKNRLQQAGSTSMTYDDEGQLATKTGNNYSFDDAHRLTNISGTTSHQYKYDGAGNRLQATRNGVTTRYIYDAAGNLLAEADNSNTITRYYVYGAGLMAMVTSGNQLYAYHFNGTGHTVAMTNSSTQVVNAYAYTPFGTIGNQQEAIQQPFKYVGQHGVMSEPNGLYYMKARYYDPSVGRFISEDPLGFEGGDVNLMAYVGNNPVMLIDPDGLVPVVDPNNPFDPMREKVDVAEKRNKALRRKLMRNKLIKKGEVKLSELLIKNAMKLPLRIIGIPANIAAIVLKAGNVNEGEDEFMKAHVEQAIKKRKTF